MSNWFTKQERTVVLFLIGCLVVGACVYIYKMKNPVFAPELNASYSKVSVDIGDIKVKTKASEEREPVKVNINKASKEELMSLPEVGPVYAQRIIEYREKNGGFKSIEEIVNINGIGKKKFEKLKESIIID